MFTSLLVSSAWLLPLLVQVSAPASPELPAAAANRAFPFTEIGARALPGVRTQCGSPEKDYIIEVNGGGVLLGDFDGDAKLDVVIVNGSTLERVAKNEEGFPPRLFLGQGDGTFLPAPEAWRMSGGRWGMGGAVGDINNDGWLDLVITQWGPVRVFLNEGGKGLAEFTEKSGIKCDSWSTSAAFLDYDKDQKLDLVVVNYLAFDTASIQKRGAGACNWKGNEVMCGPEGLTALRPRLFRGNGDGSFRDATIEAKLVPEHAGFGLGAMTLDYDDDGDTDIYIANDSTPSQLWENQGDGTFVEVGYRRGVSHDANGKELASMGIACGDWNEDGREDLFVTTFSGESNVLYTSVKQTGFRERSSSAGLAGPSIPMLGWGTSMADFDLDGDLDLYVLNGHVYPQADLPGTDTSYAQPDLYFRNGGAGKFTVEPLSGAPPAVSRASAAGDLDNDGDLDLVGLVVDGSARVFLNDAPHGDGHHWLRVRLDAHAGNAFGIGARVTAVLPSGNRVAEIRTAGGFQAAVPAEAHFGLGKVDRLKQLIVRWPSGKKTVLDDVVVDRVLVVSEDGP